MKRGSTLFLRIAVIGLGLMAIGLCVLILPAIYEGWDKQCPDATYLKFPVLVLLSATVVPFFVALFQTMKLLGYIDKNKVFSVLSTKALKVIKYACFLFGGLYAALLPAIYVLAQTVDAPGVMGIGLTMTSAPLVIGVFAGVFEGLVQNAIDIKSENDLTV